MFASTPRKFSASRLAESCLFLKLGSQSGRRFNQVHTRCRLSGLPPIEMSDPGENYILRLRFPFSPDKIIRIGERRIISQQIIGMRDRRKIDIGFGLCKTIHRNREIYRPDMVLILAAPVYVLYINCLSYFCTDKIDVFGLIIIGVGGTISQRYFSEASTIFRFDYTSQTDMRVHALFLRCS